jgi:methyl-accepting chemotaxis protein
MKIQDIKIGYRITLIVGVALLVILTTCVVILSRSIGNSKIADTNLRELDKVKDISYTLSQMVADNEEKEGIAAVIVKYRASDLSQNIVVSPSTMDFTAINQDSKVSTFAKVNTWSFKGVTIQRNDEIAKDISTNDTKTEMTVFQRIPQGYMRISTTLLGADGHSAVGTYIPNESKVAQALSRGDTYRGKAIILDEGFCTTYVPIVQNGKVIGALFSGKPYANNNQIKKLLGNKDLTTDNSYTLLIARDGEVEAGDSHVGEDFTNVAGFKAVLDRNNDQGQLEVKQNGEDLLVYYCRVPEIDSYVVTFLTKSKMMAVVRQTKTLTIVVMTFGELLCLIVIVIVSLSISNALKKLVTLSKNIANGDLTAHSNIDQKDEVGELASSLDAMVNNLRNVIGKIKNGAEIMFTAGQEFSQTSVQLSEDSTEQASSVEEVSSTIEQITANIEQNAENAIQTETNSTLSLRSINEVSKLASQTADANRKIAEKISVISEIALQTNILALNAAVEAARAGEYGKGFAVVASEVRKLAEHSKEAANEIIGLSTTSLRLAETTGTQMQEALPVVQKTTSLVQEISAANQEQSHGINQINEAMAQLSGTTQHTASVSEEMSANAETLLSQAKDLQELVSFFKVDN